MQSKHKYIWIFGGISICYLLIMMLVGHFENVTSNASSVSEKHSVKLIMATGASIRTVSPSAVNVAEAENTAEPEASTAPEESIAPEASAVPEVSTAPEVTAMPETTEVPKPTAKPTPTPNPVFYGYKHISKERQTVVNLAKTYVGKISYYWGGKPSGNDITGKTDPHKLDCSGFIQFIYSKVAGKKLSSVGATISIVNLEKIKKGKLKPGDIGLKKGTGSRYFDADGKSYSEPSQAEEANHKKAGAAKEKVEDLEEQLGEIEDTIEEKRGKIGNWKVARRRIYEKAKEVSTIHPSKSGKTFSYEETENTEEEKLMKLYQTKYAAYYKNIGKCRKNIKFLVNRSKRYTVQLGDAKKAVKKYSKEIRRSIDHVGIYCGKDSKGREIWCHCSSSGHGVVWQNTDIFKYYYRYFKD